MKLINLVLQNFQGLDDFILELDGNDVTVFGANGVGKTTIANALSYLLFEKPSTDEKDYSPKTRDNFGNEIHGLEHIVKAKFVNSDGSVFTIMKNFHEKKKAKIGTYPNTVDYFINDESVIKADYDKFISTIFNKEQGLMLSLPLYFSTTLGWEERRKILISIAGDVLTEDVLQENPKLRESVERGSVNNLDDFRANAKIRIKELTGEREATVIRIKEANLAIPEEAETLNEEKIKASITKIKDQMDGYSKSSATEKSNLEKKHIELIQLAEEKKKTAVTLDNNLKESRRNTLLAVKKVIMEKDTALIPLKIENENACKAKSKKELELVSLIDSKKGIENTVFFTSIINEPIYCPTCGQKMPTTSLEEQKASWNHMKTEKLAVLNAKISTIETEIKENDDIINANLPKIETLKTTKDAFIAKALKLENELSAIGRCKEAIAAEEEATKIIASFASYENNTNAILSLNNENITSLKTELEEMNRKFNVVSIKTQQTERIKVLEAKLKEINDEYNLLKNDVDNINEFMRIKAKMLTQRVNSHFEKVQFRLFEELVNGDTREACIPMVKTLSGIMPFTSASYAERMNGGLEIINALSKHFKVSLPIIIDNSEAICDITKTDAQQIKLQVKKGTFALRYELN